MSRQTNEAVCIYIARVEARPRGGGSASLTCFLPAPGAAAARERLPRALKDAGFDLERIEFLKSYWDYEWTTARDQKAFDALAEQAYRSRSLVIHD